ncbi:MAG: nickel-type superoxide dismutase maturation protease [Actinomycetota bacterium]
MPFARLRVTGQSMVPTLLPGDHVLVVRGIGPFRPAVRVGDLVALVDPRDGQRTMIKRVVGFEGGGVVVRGDNEAASTDSRHFGPVRPAALRGRVVYRYHPESRRGRLRPGTRW